MQEPRIVVIGGGTGGFTLLRALKKYSKNITALVNMADDGGSTGVLRDELGVLPPGDVRQSLVALSESPKVRDLFSYRFDEGSLKGHTFGNLFLTAVEKMTGHFAEGVETAGEVLNIVGRVLPITLDNVHLAVEWPDGTQARGQGTIDGMEFEGRGAPRLWLEPAAHVNPDAAVAIQNADVVVISAGDLYTSIGPSLIVDGVSEALKTTGATVVYVCNLVTKPAHTSGFLVSDHAAEIERIAGGPILDHVLYNTAEPPQNLRDTYLKQGELLVQPDAPKMRAAHYKAWGGKFLGADTNPHVKGDALAARRSLIRHDGDALAKQIIALAAQGKP
jgi:uncharacterized cofD-like protein